MATEQEGHTPGLWHVEHRIHVKAANGYRVATVNVPNVRVGAMEINPECNARLIAAAPDLLKAGKDVEWFLALYAEYVANVPVDEIERHPYLPDLQEKLEALRAAIARATGEA